MGFQLVALDATDFSALFMQSEAALRARGAVRVTATASPGFPCRVSLDDAAVGEELLLLPFAHQDKDTPYRASGPVFIRRGVERAMPAMDTVPPYITRRLMSLRAYDAAHMLVNADVCEGNAVAQRIERMFADGAVAYLHLHFARHGCFACRVDRAA